MKYTMLIVILFSYSVAIQATSTGNCPASIGMAVNPEKASILYQKILASNLLKGEFETTSAFEIRKAQSNFSVLSKPLLVEAKYDAKSTSYDADNQKLTVFKYAWANAPTGWSDVFDYSGKKYGIKVASYAKNHGLGLGQIEKTLGSYSASNAYGASVRVTKIDRVVYSLFDRPAQKSGRRYGGDTQETWAFEGLAEYRSEAVSLPDTGAVYIDIPINIAPSLKDTMRASVYFVPKPPYTATGDRHWAAKINSPREINATYNVIVGNILCVLLTDKHGKVLKIIDTGY